MFSSYWICQARFLSTVQPPSPQPLSCPVFLHLTAIAPKSLPAIFYESLLFTFDLTRAFILFVLFGLVFSVHAREIFRPDRGRVERRSWYSDSLYPFQTADERWSISSFQTDTHPRINRMISKSMNAQIILQAGSLLHENSAETIPSLESSISTHAGKPLL